MRFVDQVNTLISYFLLLIIGIILAPFVILFLLLPERWRYESKIWFSFLQCIYWLILRISFLSITIVGKRNMPREPAIIAVNHQSSLDVPLVGVLMRGFPHVWLALADFFHSRFLRFVMSRIAVPVDTSSPQKAVRSLVRAIALIRDKKMHAIIFPEGGRYNDGRVHDFYAGFVMLAKKTGRPGVPVYLDNAGKVYPPGTFFAHRYPITITIGKPMHFKEGESDKDFQDRVYAWFVEQSER